MVKTNSVLRFPRLSVCHFNMVNCRNLDRTLEYSFVSLPGSPEGQEGYFGGGAEITEEVAARYQTGTHQGLGSLTISLFFSQPLYHPSPGRLRPSSSRQPLLQAVGS